MKLGGKGKVVEIDESLVAKIKTHRGKDLKIQQVWIFGLISRECKKCNIENINLMTIKSLAWLIINTK